MKQYYILTAFNYWSTVIIVSCWVRRNSVGILETTFYKIEDVKKYLFTIAIKRTIWSFLQSIKQPEIERS